MTPRVRSLWVLAATAALAVAGAPSCTIGKGQGTITGTLSAPDCWSGSFDLAPDYFAAVPYRDSLVLRVQKGSDFQNFSDGISILVDNARGLRDAKLGEPLAISLPPEVTPPGVPVRPQSDPASVHLTLYLQRTCRIQNVALYAVDGVQLDGDGACSAIGVTPPLQCPGGTTDAGAPDAVSSDAAPIADASIDGVAPVDDASAPDAGAPETGAGQIGRSTITFSHIFDGDPDESNAAERLTEASFDVYLADPREICPGGLGPPPPCRGHLNGNFKFYFQRGRPAQPFP
jgi:hypothetical protein